MLRRALDSGVAMGTTVRPFDRMPNSIDARSESSAERPPTYGGDGSCAESVDLPDDHILTHTHGLVACVVARHPVGIDAEWLGRKLDLRIASSVLAPQELHELSRWPLAQRHTRLLEYWTLKEAFIKATGKGISQPLKRFWFQLARPRKPAIAFAAGEPYQDDQWQFVQHNELSPEHLLAVAVKLPVHAMLRVEMRHWC